MLIHPGKRKKKKRNHSRSTSQSYPNQKKKLNFCQWRFYRWYKWSLPLVSCSLSRLPVYSVCHPPLSVASAQRLQTGEGMSPSITASVPAAKATSARVTRAPASSKSDSCDAREKKRLADKVMTPVLGPATSSPAKSAPAPVPGQSDPTLIQASRPLPQPDLLKSSSLPQRTRGKVEAAGRRGRSSFRGPCGSVSHPMSPRWSRPSTYQSVPVAVTDLPSVPSELLWESVFQYFCCKNSLKPM